MDHPENYQRFLSNLLNIFDSNERFNTINQQCHIFSKSTKDLLADFYEYLHYYLELELKVINSSATVLEGKVKKAALDEWLKNHIPDKKDREQVYESLVIKEHKAEYYRINDLLSLKKEKNSYIVSELVRCGEFLMLAAAPKTGKSLLATNLAMAVVMGKDFLNRKTYPTNVLFINNEENPMEVGKRIYYQGLQEIEATNKDQFDELISSDRFFLCKYLDIVQDFDELRTTVLENNIGLVIIDSLGASIKKSGMTEYSVELLPYLYSLQEDLCHKYNVSCIILHHTTKMDSSENKTKMLNGISGGSFLTRANDGYWKLMAGSKDEKDLLNLICVPRNDKEKTFTLSIVEDEACKWEFAVLKESSIPESEVEIQNNVLNELRKMYEAWEGIPNNDDPVYGLNLLELLEITGCDRKTLVRIINRMLHSDGIERYTGNGKHIYHYPICGESWLDSYLELDKEKLEKKAEMEKFKKVIKSEILPILSSNEHKDYVSCWERVKGLVPSNVSVLSALTEADKDRFLSYLHNSKYKLGDEVMFKEKKTKIIKVIYSPSNPVDRFLYVLKERPESFTTYNDLS